MAVERAERRGAEREQAERVGIGPTSRGHHHEAADLAELLAGRSLALVMVETPGTRRQRVRLLRRLAGSDRVAIEEALRRVEAGSFALPAPVVREAVATLHAAVGRRRPTSR